MTERPRPAFRGPIIKWGLEAFASGDYTISSLTDALVALGLTTRPTARQGGKPVTTSFVGRMLRNPYYTGLVTWGEVQARGNHEPLISVETFARNQSILESHRAGEKQRTHPHYLRSTVYCRRCGSRLCFTRATGSKGGRYDYYFCLGRHQKRTDCDLPFIPVDDIENEIEAHYATTQLLTENQRARLREMLEAVLEDRAQHARTVTTRQTKRIQRLDAQRDKLLDAFLTGSVPVEVLKRKQDAITAELAQAEQAIREANIEADTIRRNLDLALQLAGDASWAYQQASTQGRRHWNQALFDRIEVDYHEPVYTRLADPFAQMVEAELLRRLEAETANPGTFNRGRGLKEHYLAEGVGFEPTVTRRPQRLSRPSHSSALATFRRRCYRAAGRRPEPVAVAPWRGDRALALLPDVHPRRRARAARRMGARDDGEGQRGG